MATSTEGKSKSRRFLLLYGSQTGQAEAIAGLIHEEAKTRGYTPELYCISSSEKKFDLSKEPVAVIVVSTTGEGEPPDTVNRFWRKLKRSTQPQGLLKDLQYALLGLGDTNYTNFCNMGKMLNKRLLELGARWFHETGYADDGVGLELVVEPWIEGLWPALDAVFSPSTDQDTPKDAAQKTSTDQDTPKDTGNDKPGPTDHQSSDVAQKTVESSSQVDSLGVDVDEKLSIKTETGSDDFETSLRGSRDDSWINQVINLPTLQPKYLEVQIKEPVCDSLGSDDFLFTDSVQGFTMASSVVVNMAAITNRRVLTSSDAQKTVLELELDWSKFPETRLRYEPGDALCLMCPNDHLEVDYIIKRLGLESASNHCISISVVPNTGKKNPIIPKHIPSTCTVYQYFKHCADLRAVPKKALLLVLAEFCSNEVERRRLQWFASRQGSQDYMKLIAEAHLDLLDVLHFFPSCNPSLSRLIELLPRLQPRHYSVVSSPLDYEFKTRIAFNIVELPQRSWQRLKREGLCTGWLNESSLSEVPSTVPLYPRLKNPFHLPPDPLVPIVLIGPGTGVSPLVGFLNHRSTMVANGFKVGKSWLFFGCRHPDKDYLYRSEIEGFLSAGVLTLCNVSFSQYDSISDGSSDHAKYVQDNMRKHWEALGEWVMEENASVFVCGDAQKMIVSIREAMTDVLQKYWTHKGGVTGNGDGQKLLKDLQDKGRYVTDLWI
uniref:Methionine synthase reductase n=1 Tax=Amphimedon queenslandica TaxID=400682 RepID=A0A1X7VBA2_AMPQE